MSTCYQCNRNFSSDRALYQHYNDSPAHNNNNDDSDDSYDSDDSDEVVEEYECETCSRTFRTQQACNQHMAALGHWAPTYECDTCAATFASEAASNQHMNALGHWQHFCSDCRLRFENDNNLKMHLNSRKHRGTTVECPFCHRRFVGASGVSHHVESQACPEAPTLNRESLHRILRQRDPRGFVTMKQIEWYASEQAWNGEDYECYLCHDLYEDLEDLNDHLRSNAHKQKLYHCPNRQCDREFVSLAGMFNHLESEACGFVRFERVQQGVNGFISGKHRLIGF